mgnify:CR=1 FL=1
MGPGVSKVSPRASKMSPRASKITQNHDSDLLEFTQSLHANLLEMALLFSGLLDKRPGYLRFPCCLQISFDIRPRLWVFKKGTVAGYALLSALDIYIYIYIYRLNGLINTHRDQWDNKYSR